LGGAGADSEERGEYSEEEEKGDGLEDDPGGDCEGVEATPAAEKGGALQQGQDKRRVMSHVEIPLVRPIDTAGPVSQSDKEKRLIDSARDVVQESDEDTGNWQDSGI